MPTNRFTTLPGKASGPLGCFMALALPAFLVTVEPASAGGSANLSCVGAGRSVSCAAVWGGGGAGFPRILHAPGARADENAAAAERERRWLARCQPTIAPDRYGIGRYTYKAAGCEFGAE